MIHLPRRQLSVSCSLFSQNFSFSIFDSREVQNCWSHPNTWANHRKSSYSKCSRHDNTLGIIIDSQGSFLSKSTFEKWISNQHYCGRERVRLNCSGPFSSFPQTLRPRASARSSGQQIEEQKPQRPLPQ